MVDNIRMTRTTQDVLRVLLDGLQEDLHGLEICRRTGLGSGTMYPILARLERAGWVTAAWEAEGDWLSPADGKPRPRRRYYVLTGEGQRLAATEVSPVPTAFGRRDLGEVGA